jgi:hypothetical protein
MMTRLKLLLAMTGGACAKDDVGAVQTTSPGRRWSGNLMGGTSAPSTPRPKI